MNHIGEYDYATLRAAALSQSATQEDIDALGEWFSRFGSVYWNGEYYDADGVPVRPIYQKTAEDEYGIVGYEIG